MEWYEKVNINDVMKQHEVKIENNFDEAKLLELQHRPAIEETSKQIENGNNSNDNNREIEDDSNYDPGKEIDHSERVRALYIQWLELLLHDQTALSQILHAEATHIQAFLSEDRQFSSYPTRKDIVAFQETVGKVIDSLNEKQRIHIKLLDSSIKLFQQGERAE